MRGPSLTPRLGPSVRAVVSALVFALILLALRPALAGRPVIPPEREGAIAELFAPHQLGESVEPGWTLHSFSIDVATIHVWLAGPGGEFAHLAFDHPDYAPGDAERVGSFAVSVPATPSGSEDAVASVIAAVGRNDDGEFWAVHGTIAPDPDPDGPLAPQLPPWVKDGLALFALLFAITAALLVVALRSAAPWIRLGLGGVVLVGIVLRLGLTPLATLEPWSYQRFMVVARLVYESPLLGLIHPDPISATSVITATVLGCALAAPIAVFLMSRYLLADDRAALFAAGIVAVLPLHLRFSHGDVASIPSLTLAALVFAIVQAGAREPRLRWTITMILVLAPPLVVTFLLRPLNILYAPLVIVAALIDQGVWVDKPALDKRRLLALAIAVTGLTVGIGIPALLAEFGDQVREGLGVRTLVSMIEVLFSFEYNSLINPRFTPPGLAVLAAVGGWDLARRKRWRLLVFLAGWLLASLGTHAYVVPISPFMQARYHLHLVVPFVCLAACGIEAVLVRLAEHHHRRPATLALFGYLLASPLIHSAFIRDVEFNDQREWRWVHDLRESIPAECTIVEYGGDRSGARFARVGAYMRGGVRSKRWHVVEIPAPAPGEPEIPDAVRELLANPPECSYWYEGMTCFGNRPPDTGIAPVCDAIPGFVDLAEVERIEFESRPYDENLARGLGEHEPIVLRLFRIHRRESEH